MKTTTTAVILLALVLLTAVQPVEAMEKPEISNTRTASCLVKITSDEAILPLNEFAVDYLLRSSGVAGKAAREVLDISPDIASQLFEIDEIFGVDSPLGGYRGYDGYGGYGSGYGGYGGGMGLPTDSTPGASTLGTTTTSRSTRRTTPTPGARTTTSPTRTPSAPTPRRPTRTTTPTRPKPTLKQPIPSTTEQTILFRLHVDLINAEENTPAEDIKPAAEEFMVALIENLRSALRGAFDEYSDKLKDQLKNAAREADRAEAELVHMQKQLREFSGSRDLSRNLILRDISSLRQKIQSAKMEQASNKALMEATTKRIAQIETDLKEEIGKDRVTDELQRIFELQFNRLEETKKLVQQGSVSSDELADAEEKLARARIELAKRREELSKSAGGDRINSLNQQLSDYSIQVTRAEAERLLAIADDYELLSLKAEIARQNLEETLLWRARLGRNIRSIQPPDVTVIGAE